MKAPTREQLESWLDDADIRHRTCPECEGIHLSDTEEKLGVLESRLLLEDDRLLFLTELAIRPSAVLPLQGSMHLMNQEHPMIKLFLALDDDDVPRLSLSASLPSQGLTREFFDFWLPPVLLGENRVIEQALGMEILFLEDDSIDNPEGEALH